VYSLADTARILRIPADRLRYWERTRLVQAAESPGHQGFGFEDLVDLRRLVSLLERGIPLRRIRHSLEALRRQLPELEQPLRALRVWGGSRVVARHAGLLIEPDGQLVLDLEPAGRPAAVITALPRGCPAERAPEEASPTSADEWFERGCRLEAERGGRPAAEQAYRRALDLDPQFADAWCNLGSLHLDGHQRERAQICFEAALRSDPGHLEAHFNLANLLAETGRREAALRHYHAALQRDPFFADAHLNAALLCEKLGQMGWAREHWRRYLQVVPDGSWSDLARQRLDPARG